MKNELYSILDELRNYRNSRSQLEQKYVKERLNQSMKSYYDSLEKSLKFLSNQDLSKVVRQINKF